MSQHSAAYVPRPDRDDIRDDIIFELSHIGVDDDGMVIRVVAAYDERVAGLVTKLTAARLAEEFAKDSLAVERKLRKQAEAELAALKAQHETDIGISGYFAAELAALKAENERLTRVMDNLALMAADYAAQYGDGATPQSWICEAERQLPGGECCSTCAGSGHHGGAFGCFRDVDHLFVNTEPSDCCHYDPSLWKEGTP